MATGWGVRSDRFLGNMVCGRQNDTSGMLAGEAAMGETRRMAGLPMLSVVLAVAAVTQVTAFTQSASASTPRVRQMNFACALKSNGLMSYLQWPPPSAPGSRPHCASQNQSLVRITPGPVHVCVHGDHEVFLIAAPSSCRKQAGDVTALTLPPPKNPVYFCASDRTDVLTHPTKPRRCNVNQF